LKFSGNKSGKNRAVFLYRCHDYNEVIDECYGNLMRNMEDFRQSNEQEVTVELYLIGDQLHTDMRKRILADHIEGKRYSFKSKFIEVKSNEQKEKLVSGEACSPKHYTLYITSVLLCKGLQLKNEDVVFFVEDDYKFKKDALELCYRFARKFKNDFISPFDHPDRYSVKHKEKEDMARELYLQEKKFRINSGRLGKNEEITKKGYINYKLELIWEFNHHWRTVISTCHTFLGTYRALKNSEPYLFNTDMQRGDHVMWTHIWAAGKSKLWSPVPGLARHLGHNAKTALLEDGNYDQE